MLKIDLLYSLILTDFTNSLSKYIATGYQKIYRYLTRSIALLKYKINKVLDSSVMFWSFKRKWQHAKIEKYVSDSNLRFSGYVNIYDMKNLFKA